MNFSKKMSFVFFSAVLFLQAVYNEEINTISTNPGIEAITEISIKKPIKNVHKFVRAGELVNKKVVFATKDASEEEKLKTRENNKTFQSYEMEIESAERAIRRDEIPDNLKYYIYKVKKEDVANGNGFNQIASSFDQRQGTLATINQFDSPDAVKPGMTIILPVMQGLYIAENPTSDFEILLKKEYENEISAEDSMEDAKKQLKKSAAKKVEIDGKKYDYLPGKSISSTAKAFFDSQKQNDKMILPLSRKILTSPFGYRTSPISGKWKLHAGIDLAAPIGTDVFACKSGTILESGFNEIYGNYIVIRHSDNKTSTYAHLSKRLVERNQKVSTGTKIGKVGTTGASTGPHLHFEVRENGKATDPTKYIR